MEPSSFRLCVFLTLLCILQTVLSIPITGKSDHPESRGTETRNWIHDPLLNSRLIGPFQAQDDLSASLLREQTDRDLQQLIADFLEIPDAEENRKFVFDLTREPHIAGRENTTSVYVLEAFQDMGFRAWIDDFESRVNYPIQRKVEMTEPVQFECEMQEIVYPEDPTSGLSDVPTFNGYSPSGDVEGELVYVNYGMIEDYEYLDERNVSLEGKIVIARYGGNFRGTKVQLAEMRGAIGFLLYSDPQDDGFQRGEVFPNGPWRPESSVQRGSCLFLMHCPGNPIPERLRICGYDENNTGRDGGDDSSLESIAEHYAGPNGRIQERSSEASDDPVQGILVPSIPVQPLSYADAMPLLQQLRGLEAPEKWQGGLDLEYHIGPGPAKVRIQLEMEYADKPMQNVFARIPGAERPNEQIIIGAHRDAWVFGSVDPISGTSAMLETARAFSILMKEKGWKPRRSILFASWDTEEYGLIGSVQFGEDNTEQLRKTTLAYLNLDAVVSGPNFGLSASPTLSGLVRWAAGKVRDPQTNKTLDQVWNGEIGVLGSGSDFTVFLHHLGIPSLDFGFSGLYGVYHSNYDSYFWTSEFGDPGFRYHRTASEFTGVLALGLLENTVLPIDLPSLLRSLQKYLATANETAVENGMTNLDFRSLRESITELQEKSQKWLELMDTARRENWSLQKADDINEVLFRLERGFLYQSGLPGRPWFKHVLQAPGIYLGYGSESFPGLMEAIRNKDERLAKTQIHIIAERISFVASKFKEDKETLSEGTIVGLAVGGGVLILISLVCLIFWRRRRQKERRERLAERGGEYQTLPPYN